MTLPVERDHIGIFGKMNAGKSSVMNLLTQRDTSIVDPTPGTTADTKTALMELHGLGPVKIFDTAGADEGRGLGERKRRRVTEALKESDLVLLVIDPSSGDFAPEAGLLAEARSEDKQVLVLYNLFRPGDAARRPDVEAAVPGLRFHRALELSAVDPAARPALLEFILAGYDSPRRPLPLLPFAERDRYVILVIPMDEETPAGRFLRPQAMVEEFLVRRWAWPLSFRPDLGRARGADAAAREAERARFDAVVRDLGARLAGVITDSQAMDVISRWAPERAWLTTFSIIMIQHQSRGRLAAFAEGLKVLPRLKAGDRVLIAEACAHSRVAEDIGTVQIPRHFRERFPGVAVDHHFGGEFPDRAALDAVRLIIHCGGCMLAPQKMAARLRDLEALGLPFTNYGLFLSALQGPAALRRVLAPWGLEP